LARKGWSGLSSAYRARLEKAGISQKDYEGGASIQGARGHAQTPENPRRYDKTKYTSYEQRRKTLLAQVEAKKDAMWAGTPKWEKEKSDRNLRTEPVSMATLKWFLKSDDEEIFDAFLGDTEVYAWFGYH
jgi:hypothetical protein